MLLLMLSFRDAFHADAATMILMRRCCFAAAMPMLIRAATLISLRHAADATFMPAYARRCLRCCHAPCRRCRRRYADMPSLMFLRHAPCRRH